MSKKTPVYNISSITGALFIMSKQFLCSFFGFVLKSRTIYFGLEGVHEGWSEITKPER